MQPLIAIVGPTASGKTALAVTLAQQFQGELVSADAKQLFRGMDIGTNKEKDLSVPQYLIDVFEPGIKPTVYWFQQEAYRCIDAILKRGHQPIMVGGSMLYAESVLKGYQFEEGQKSSVAVPRYRTLALGIRVDSDALKQRLQARTDQWLQQGLLDEIRALQASGVSDEWLSWCGLEYRWFSAYLRGELSLEEATYNTNRDQWQYIRRQYTWWRRYRLVQWVQSTEEAIQIASGFLSA